IEAGFWLLDEFPDPDGEWHCGDLFATFQRRLPQTWTPEEWAHLGVRPEEGIEYLRVTGGRLPTDTMEFLEPISIEDVETYHLRFAVAGWRYYEGERVIGELRPGTRVRLELEEDNRFDVNAIRVLSPSGAHIGYVPAVYGWCLTESVRSGQYRATVAEVGPAEDPAIRLVVELEGQAASLLGDRVVVRAVPERLERYAEVVLA
ncbi:MAG: HIRAN domain-containing protein, partial [Bacillota bacterium]|nr:HIRAN domain-containing protein [Bacillota bacterium]